ncbi:MULTISPECIES: NAD-dependent succinate-semialdehyde dehydrogenase [unclassified Guyparkeria]|uniref:NAD-dependent succinate-semialdehyde dehydrogenase n=1 Tax=unclassified Guyparkeria TaxID=2626246 RepID=UPI0007339441|nr:MULTISPECIES: NAD-dependent succinate-semialdehyde dehydrogenase [unclassified Guyparkeria]KTG16609.1 succinate-semialdehyde dehydrogenase [Guyparkeria sp. XI15]OAE85643.1 succinate-semialdehyde dehydrogenase [Guyparkeria sp. WRN-7]
MTQTVINPTNGQRLHEFPVMDPAQRETVLERSEAAYRDWRKTSFAERADLLRRVAQVMRDDRERLALLMTDEMGKPIREARGEVDKAAWCAEHYADNAENYLATEMIDSDATVSYVQYLPIGTVLGILPWNAPFWLAFRFAAPALMAGNTCVMKHDAHVPACAAGIAESFEKAGFPQGVFQNLPLQTEDIAGAIQHECVRAVSFTGSDRAGSIVASTAARHIKPAVLELGGSDPVIVLADADLEAAADTVVLSRIINAGQSCIAAKRIIVEESVYEPFLKMLKERFAKLKMGDPREESTDVGPIARADLRDNLHRQVVETIDAGARCLIGGEMPKGDGYFYPVTLLADVDDSMVAFCEETFGPLATAICARDCDEAMEMANSTQYGLGAAIWTSDVPKAIHMARDIEAGQVSINGIVKTDPRLPSGGVKHSGYGRELGPHGIKMFVNAQQVWVGPKTG